MPRGLLPPTHCMDPMLQYQLNSMYGPGARERMELEHLEREKREREIRELRERELNDRLKEEIMKSGMRGPPNPMDPHWLEIQRRYAAAGLAGPAGKRLFFRILDNEEINGNSSKCKFNLYIYLKQRGVYVENSPVFTTGPIFTILFLN